MLFTKGGKKTLLMTFAGEPKKGKTANGQKADSLKVRISKLFAVKPTVDAASVRHIASKKQRVTLKPNKKTMVLWMSMVGLPAIWLGHPPKWIPVAVVEVTKT